MLSALGTMKMCCQIFNLLEVTRDGVGILGLQNGVEYSAVVSLCSGKSYGICLDSGRKVNATVSIVLQSNP